MSLISLAPNTIPNNPFPTDAGLLAPASVFCSSRLGNDPTFAETAKSVGTKCADSMIPIIYGCGQNGLMHVVAESCLDNGGYVHGVGVESERERGLSQDPSESEAWRSGRYTQEWVQDVPTRKIRMAELSGNGSIILPGGFGTHDESASIVFENYNEREKLPVIVLSQGGFWKPTQEQFSNMAKAGMIDEEKLSLVSFIHDASDWGQATVEELERWHTEHRNDRKAFSASTTTQVSA